VAYVPAALSVGPGGVVQSQPWEVWHGRYLVGRGRTWRDAAKCMVWTIPPLRSALRRTVLHLTINTDDDFTLDIPLQMTGRPSVLIDTLRAATATPAPGREDLREWEWVRDLAIEQLERGSLSFEVGGNQTVSVGRWDGR
jgi:hypothetical protein